MHWKTSVEARMWHRQNRPGCALLNCRGGSWHPLQCGWAPEVQLSPGVGEAGGDIYFRDEEFETWRDQ